MSEIFLSDDLLTMLRGLGIVVPEEQETAVLIALEDFVDAAGDLRAAESLHRIRKQFTGSPIAVAVDRVLFGGEKSLRQAAKEAGCSAAGLLYQERVIKSILTPRLQWVSEVNNKPKSENESEQNL